MSDLLLAIDVEALIEFGGLVLVCLMVFCSVGFFFCFFLPMGGVLFAIGMLSAKTDILPSIYIVCTLLILCSIAGSILGYGTGRSAGKYLYSRKDSRFFRRSFLVSTEEFFKKYGALAMVGSYFLPIIRSFAPLLAGVVKYRFYQFIILNAIGSGLFTLAFVLAGYLIGSVPLLQPWLKYIIGFFVLAVTIPLVIKIIKVMRTPKAM